MRLDGTWPARTALVVLVGTVLFVAHALYFWRIFDGIAIDDAYISFRYAEHLSRGLGLVFNTGEGSKVTRTFYGS